MSSPSDSIPLASDKITKPREKFRTSCDACAASKVRCSKEQPRCSRCTQHDHKCVYGRSRRKDKPPGSANRPPLGAGPAAVLPPSWSGDNRWNLADIFAETSYAVPPMDHLMQGGWQEIANSMAQFPEHERSTQVASTPAFQSRISRPALIVCDSLHDYHASPFIWLDED